MVYRAHKPRTRLGAICQTEKQDAKRIQRRGAKQPRQLASVNAQVHAPRTAYHHNRKGSNAHAPEDDFEPGRTGGVESSRKHGYHAKQDGGNSGLRITEGTSRATLYVHAHTHNSPRSPCRVRMCRTLPARIHLMRQKTPYRIRIPGHSAVVDLICAASETRLLQPTALQPTSKLECPLTLTQGYGLLCPHVVSGKIRMRGT